MWSRIQYWIVSKWLLNSIIDIIDKENGYRNIQIKHPKYGIIVIHPNEEKSLSDSEDKFFPYIGYLRE